MPLQDEPYTEQVIILPSQGIWYERPEPIVDILAKTNLTGNEYIIFYAIIHIVYAHVCRYVLMCVNVNYT